MPANQNNAEQEKNKPEYVAPHSAVNYSGKLGQFSGYAVNQNDPNSPKYTIAGNAPDFQSMLNLYGSMNDDRSQPIRMLMPENYDRFNQLPQSVRAWNIERGFSQGYSNYWEDPLKVGRYYTAIKTLPEGTPLPSWLDRNGIESAYKYFESKYPGQQWTSWKPLEEGDPGIDYLRNMRIPPVTAMNPQDIKPTPVPDNSGWYTMSKEAAEQSFPTEYLKNVPKDNLGNYIFDQKTLDAWTAGTNVAGIPQPIYDKMDWKSQLGVQAQQYALPVGMFALGGAIIGGGIPGALIGAGLGVGMVELAKHWEAVQNAMLKMNIPAEEVEKIFGLWNQFKYSVKDPEAYGKVSEVLGDIKTAYEAGAVYFNAAVGPSKTGNPLDIYKQYYGMGTNKTRVTRIDYEANDKGGYDLVVKREEDLIAPDGKAITGWALHEARTRIAAGENADDVVAEIQGKFGLEGDVRELVGQMILDPLNLVDLGVNKGIAAAAKSAKRMNVYRAFASTNDIIDAAREYGRIVRFETPQQAAAHNKFARWLAGVDENGKLVEPGKGLLKAMRGLTKQALAHELLQHSQDGLKIMLTQAKGNVDAMVAIYYAIANDNPVEAAKKLADAQLSDFTMPKYFSTVDAQGVPVAYRAARKAVEELYDSYKITRPQAQVIDRMATIMSDAGYIKAKRVEDLPYQLIKKLGEMKNVEADAWFTQFKSTLETSTDPNMKSLLDQINSNDAFKTMLGSDLKKMTDLFYGKNPLPYGPEHFAALMLQDVAKAIDGFTVDYYKVKPNNAYKKMTKVIKTAQGIVLLGISPSYFLNNMLNNYVTLGWDGLLSLSSHKGRSGYFKRLGYIPERLREGFNAAEIGDNIGAMTDDLYALNQYQAGDEIRKAVKGEGKTGTVGKFLDIVDQVLHKGDKWQIAAVLSTIAERQASEMAIYKAMREFLDYNHTEGRGYSKMPEEVYLGLEALQPGLGKKIKNAIKRGLSRSEIENQVFKDWKKRSIFDVLTPEEKATITAQFPDVFDDLDNTIRNATTDAQVTDAISNARNKLQDEVNREVMRRMEEIVQGTENTVRIEGGQAIIDEANKMIMDMGNFWMEHFRYADQIAEEASKYVGKRRQAIWTRYNIVSDRNWNLFNNVQGAKWLGIHRGIGGDVAYRHAEDLLIQQHDNWANFFNTKKRLMNEFFDMSENLSKLESQMLWEQTNKQISDLYKNSLVEEDLLQARLDEIFVSEYAKQFGMPDEAQAWVTAVHEARQQMAHAMHYYRTGGDTIQGFAPLEQAVKTRIDVMLDGKIPYKMDYQTREKVMKKFMGEVYVPYIRKIMDASNSTAPGSGMPQAPITPNTPGSGAPVQATVPYDTTPPTPSEMTPRDAELLLGIEEADVRRLEQIADIELPDGRLFESTTEALDRYQAGDRLYQQMHSWQTGLPNLRSYYLDYASRITAGAEHLTGYLANRGMGSIPPGMNYDYYRAIADVVVQRGYQVYDNLNGEFIILFPQNFTAEMAQDSIRGIVNDLDNSIIKVGDQNYVGHRYYSGIAGSNARAETIANATADQYIRTHSGIDDRAVKPETQGDNSTQRVDTSAQDGTGSGTEPPQATDRVIQAADAIEDRTEPARGQPDEPLEFNSTQDIEDFAKGMEDTDSVLVSETTGEVVDADTLRARATEIRKFIAEEYGNQEFGEGKSFNDRHLINTFNQYGYKVDNLGQVTQDMARDVLDRRKAAREQFMPREVEAEMLKRSHEINQQRALEMESAVRRYALQSPKAMTREAFRMDMVDILGDVQQADAILEITDRLADYWTKHNRNAKAYNLTKDDWYKTFILQKSGEGNVRGMTRYMDDGRAIIQAFSKADISTVLHELGHVFIRQLDDVEINELNKALFGKDVGVDWARMDDATARPYQEAFAKAFERYFHDGIAPNKKLIPAFERIKNWIMDVYQSITKLDVKVSPETRKIFDRWLGGPDADDATKVVDIPPAPELSGTEVIAPMARRPEYKAFLADVNTTKPGLKEFLEDARTILPDIPEGTLTDLHRTLVEQWIKEGSALGDEVLDDYPELARAVQPVEVEGNIWDAFRRKEKQATKQMDAGEDTPLFSGTPQNVAEETFTPDPVSPQLEGPLFNQVDAPGMTRNTFMDKVHNLLHKGNKKETNRVMAVLDGMAEYWSKRSNKPAELWWTENVADVVSGEDYLDYVLKQQAQAMINTPEFKKWFGDSKIVDATGNPKIMFHGTPISGTQKLRTGTDMPFESFHNFDQVYYFSDFYTASSHGRRKASKWRDPADYVYSVYLKAENPFSVDNEEAFLKIMGKYGNKIPVLADYGINKVTKKEALNILKSNNSWILTETDEFIQAAIDNGYDAIIARNGGNDYVAVTSPTQIKSIFNQGTWDPNNPNILKQTAQVKIDTPAFKKWWTWDWNKNKPGNKASVIVDKDGKPLQVFHGTTNKVSAFNLSYVGSKTDDGYFGKGFYFTPSPEHASSYAITYDSHDWDYGWNYNFGNVIPTNLSISNPYYFRSSPIPDGVEIEYHEIYGKQPNVRVTKPDNFRKILEDEGYDGVIVERELVKTTKGLTDEQYLKLNEWYRKHKPGMKLLPKEQIENSLSKGIELEDFIGYYGNELADTMPKEKVIVEIVAFYPEQIKSTFNSGTYGVDNSEILYQRNIPDKWYYSQAKRAVEQLPQERMTVGQLQGQLKKVGVKADEMYWGGLDDFLEGKNPNDKITKAEVLDYLEQNQVNVEEVMRGKPTRSVADVWDEAYYKLTQNGDFTGEDAKNIAVNIVNDNYSHIPEDIQEKIVHLLGDTWNDLYDAGRIVRGEIKSYSDNPTRYSGYTTPGGENYRELLLTLPEKMPEVIDTADWNARAKNIQSGELKQYKSPHWEEPNVLAHIRFDDRVDVDGKKVLFLEEIQSDWHQAGREKGYVGEPVDKTKLPEGYRIEEITNQEGNKYYQVYDRYDDPVTTRNTKEAAIEITWKLFDDDPGITGQVPPAPFSKNWEELAMKRMIRYAAENGYDRIAWTPGKVQADRYNLAKYIDKIDYSINEDFTVDTHALNNGRLVHSFTQVMPDKLRDYFGVDITNKIVDDVNTKKALHEADMQEYQNLIKQAESDNSSIDKNAIGDRLNELDDKYNGSIDKPKFEGATIAGEEELAVGGEGMKAFYDQKLPNIANKYIKKWGGKVGETRISAPETAGGGDAGRLNYEVYAPDGSIYDAFETRVAAEQAARDNGRGYTVKGIDRQVGLSVPAFDITPEMKQSVMAGQALFQEAKGAVSWADNSKALIHAMEAGDFTTTLHESGHIYLKSLVGVADDDLAEVTKWLNDEYKLNLQKDWILEPVQANEAAHEAFARGFERYLQEGRAPIPRLQQVFEDLKKWMTEIYNKVRGLEGVKLNDDIRRVFDKWVSGGNNIVSLDEGRINTIISSRKNLDQYLKEIGIEPTAEDYEVQAFGILEGMHNKLLRDRRTTDLATNIKNAAEVDAQFAKAKYKLFTKDPVESNTPFQVAEVASYLADIQPGDRVFEPYAGTGNMIEPIRLVDGVQITANDFDPAMQNVLTDLGYTRVTGQDMQTTRPGRSYNKIITSPPSGPGTTQYKMPIATEDVSQAYIHAALEHLADGGRLVAVVPMNWASRLDPDTLLIDTYITPYLQYLQDRYQTAFIEIPQESWNGRAMGGRHAILVVDNIPPKGTPVAHIDDLAPNTMDDLAKLVDDIKKTQVIPDEDKLAARNIAYMKPEDMPQMSDTSGLAQPMGYGTRDTFAYMGTNKINMIKKVVDLYDLIPSHLINFQANPKYPAELQPRLSRGGFAGKEQVLDIAKNLDPDKLLDDTRGIDDFCPIVRADNVVVSGNGRAMSMVYAAEYHPDNIQKYIERLREVLPDHGLSEADLAGKKIPVLVREITDDIDLKKFAQTANMPAGMTLNDIEIIKISKDYVDLQDFSLLQIGDWQSVEGALRNSVNAEVIGKFIERLPQDMRNQFIDNDGLLSHKGANYLQSAILFRVYGNEQGQKLAAAFINYDSAGIKNMQTAMMESLGMLVKAEALVEKGLRDPDLSIANDIAIVVDKYAQLLAQKDVSVGAYLATNTLFDDGLTPLQKSLLGYFDKYSRSRKELREFIIAYAEKVIEQNPPEQMSFTPPPTKAEILSGIAKNFDFNETEELAKVRSQNANETMSRIQAEAGEGDIFKNIEAPEGFEAPEQMPAQPEAPQPGQIPGQPAPQPVARQPRTTRRRQPRQPAPQPEGMPAMGAPLGSGDGLTQMPIVESEVETWLRNIMPLLDKLEAGLTGTNVPIEQTIQNLDQVVPPQVMKKLKGYLGQVYADMADEMIGATRFAEGMRDFSLHNYGNKYEWDEYAQSLYPYHFWYTRSMVNWMLRGMTRPAYWSNYVRMKEFIDKYTMKDGFPARLQGKVGVHAAWLPDFAGDTLYLDPMKILYPHEQLMRPFERMASDNNKVEKRAMQILADMYEEGQISDAEHDLAKSKQGPDWATAVVKARQDADLEVNNAFDFASLISSPSLPLSYAYYLQSGQQDKINQLPITKTIMHTSKLLGMGGDYGINIEEGWRKKNNMPLIDRWEDYRVDVMMANMVAEGKCTLEEMKMATMERSGPIYQEAVRRSSMVGTMRFFGASLGLDIFPEGEQLGRQLTDDYYKAIEEKKQGNKNAVNDFLEKHPEYAARQFALDDPDRRARYFLINGIWDKYMNMNSLEKDAVRDQLGNLFQDAFLDKETRSYDAIDDETLTFWARTLGSAVPSTAPNTPTQNLKMPSQEDMQKYNEKNRYYDEREKLFPGIGAKLQWYYAGEGNRMPDPEIEAYNKWNTQFLAENPHIIPEVIGETNELSGLPNDVQAYVYQYRALRDQMYPNIFDIQDEYYQIGDSKKRKEYLKTNPMLPAYWNWRRVYASQYTKAAPYILSEESLAKDIAGDAYDIINFDPSNISPLITKELIRSEMYGQPIDSHVMEAITNEWEASGKIGGDLQTFIYGYLLPSLQMPTP